MTISFFVQGIPVAKGRARITTVGGFPKAYTPQKTRDYETQVAWQAKSAMNGFPPLVGPLECEISIFLPIPKSRKKTFDGDPHIVKGDLDNYCKAILDSCNGICYIDDAQIYSLTAEKRYSDNPRAVVTLVNP